VGDNHAQGIAHDSVAVGVAGNIDGRECRRCESAAFTLCASASGLKVGINYRFNWSGYGYGYGY
jgi:hypothetical protein